MVLFCRKLYLGLRGLVKMAKLSRQKLKNVVKECLVEILQEGLVTQSSSPSMNLNESNSRKVSRMKSAQQTRDLTGPNGHAPMSNRSRAADNISYGTKNTAQQPNPQFDQRVNNTISHLTDDPVMAAIFSDSARTTLQEQRQAEHRSPVVAQGDQATRAMASSDPSELFAGASQNWADLAFSD